MVLILREGRLEPCSSICEKVTRLREVKHHLNIWFNMYTDLMVCGIIFTFWNTSNLSLCWKHKQCPRIKFVSILYWPDKIMCKFICVPVTCMLRFTTHTKCTCTEPIVRTNYFEFRSINVPVFLNSSISSVYFSFYSKLYFHKYVLH